MNIKKLFRRRDRTADISSQSLLDFLGVSGGSSEALNESTYFACIKILSESIGKLPLKLMHATTDGGIEKASKHSLYRVLSMRPNPYMTATHFWSTVEFNRNHYGNAYVWITGAGSDIALWILPSDKVSVWVDDAGLFGNENAIWYVYKATNQKEYRIPYDSIMHFKTSASFDGILGMSIRDKLKTTLKGSTAAQEMLNGLFKSGFTAKAVLQYTGDLNDEARTTFASKIEDYATGKIDTVHSIIPIPLGTTLTPLNTKLADNEFVGLKQYSALQIAAAFGIKPCQINDYTKSSYAASEQQQLAFYVDTLLYILKQYEEEITCKLLSEEDIKAGYYAKFNVAVILRADLKTQLEALAQAVQNTLYTPNEARVYLDKKSLPGGDQLICNGNIIPLTKIGTQYGCEDEGGEKNGKDESA